MPRNLPGILGQIPINTYIWVFETELIAFMDKLVRTELALDGLDVFIDVLVLAQVGLEHVVLLTVDLAPYWFLLAAFPSLHQVLLFLLVETVLVSFLATLLTARLSQQLFFVLRLKQPFLLETIAREKLISLDLVDLGESVL